MSDEPEITDESKCEVGGGNDGTLHICCSSHKAIMCMHHYARTHFVQTIPEWNGPGCND